MLTDEQLNDYCLIDKGSKSCRYLCSDLKDKAYYCLKKSSKKELIDLEIDAFIARCDINNTDPQSYSLPLGDNCVGYPFLKTIRQGHNIQD